MFRFELNKDYPYHLAPWIGAALIGLIGVRIRGWQAGLYLAPVGFFAGCILWVLTDPANEKAGAEGVSPAKIFWAIVGLLLCWIPVLGLMFSLISLAVNGSCKHWAVRKCTLASICISRFSILSCFVWLIITYES